MRSSHGRSIRATSLIVRLEPLEDRRVLNGAGAAAVQAVSASPQAEVARELVNLTIAEASANPDAAASSIIQSVESILAQAKTAAPQSQSQSPSQPHLFQDASAVVVGPEAYPTVSITGASGTPGLGWLRSESAPIAFVLPDHARELRLDRLDQGAVWNGEAEGAGVAAISPAFVGRPVDSPFGDGPGRGFNEPLGPWATDELEMLAALVRPQPGPWQIGFVVEPEPLAASDSFAERQSEVEREDMRIIRELRNAETEAAPVVANSDGSSPDAVDENELRRRQSSGWPEGPAAVAAAEPAPADAEVQTASLNRDRPAWSGQSQDDDDQAEPAPSTIAASGAELLAGFLPFERATIERTIDELLGGLGEIGLGLPDLGFGSTGELLPKAVAAGAAILAVEIARRHLRDKQKAVAEEEAAAEARGEAGSPRLPGFPGDWTMEDA